MGYPVLRCADYVGVCCVYQRANYRRSTNKANVNIRVNEVSVWNDQVGYPTMNFGQSRPGVELCDYEIMLGVNEFQDLIQYEFDRFIVESKADDEATSFEDAIPEMLRNDYRCFEEMLRVAPSDVCKLVRRHLFLELLESAFGENTERHCQFAINSISEIVLDGNNVLVKGKAFAINRTKA